MPATSFDLQGYQLILASKSPRRQELLKGLGFDFEVRTKEIDEDHPEFLKRGEIPLYLSKKKAKAFQNELKPNELLITSDTVVCLGDLVFNKPASPTEAIEMLQTLSGKSHEVITGVCLTSVNKQSAFIDTTTVTLIDLDRSEIEFYVETYKPFDKAGAYGIQEWIGYAGIEKIEGSYFNVVGLPTQKLYIELKKFLKP